jgi:hypothetical protein
MAYKEIEMLREENLFLKKKFKDPAERNECIEDRTFVTKGSENPTIFCDNW